MSLPLTQSGISPVQHRTAPGALAALDPLDYLGFADHAVLLTGGYYTYSALSAAASLPASIAAALVAGSLMFALSAYARQLYRYHRMENIVRQCMPFAFAFFQMAMATAATLFLIPSALPAYAKLWLFIWLSISFAGMGVLRMAFWLAMADPRRLEAYARKVILVGANEKTGQMIHDCLQHPGRYRIVGLYAAGGMEPGGIPRVPLISSLWELSMLCAAGKVDDIIITPELESSPQAQMVFKMLETLPCSIKCCIAGHFLSRPLTKLELISHMPIATIFERPLRGAALHIKRAEDIMLSMLILMICAPLMLLIAGLVALDGQGQILFRQKRHGFGGSEFHIYKFRSLHVRVAHEGDMLQVTRDDARVTLVGEFLRKYSFDELPQLFNVLRGDMSMVGPRPHAVAHNYYYRELIDGYAARQRIKPGITGWAQVNGWRGQTDTLEKMRRRIEHDLYYAENWSLWFDIKILILTLVTFLRHENAY